jgi:hypothetical protein
VIKQILIAFIRVYQWLAPLKALLPAAPVGQCCRFHPSCSAYACDAIERRGPVRGLWLTLKRLARCHPWNDGGFDPVPE